MHRFPFTSLVAGCVVALLLGAATGCEPAKKEPAAGVAEPVELQFDYAVAIEDEREAEGLRRVGRDFRFRSGDRFLLVFRPEFEAYAYLFHRPEGGRNYTRLFPHPRIGVENPLAGGRETRVPDGKLRWTLDEKRGMEQLVLVVSSAPWRVETDSGGRIGRDRFERRLAELELSRRPGSYSALEEDAWSKLFFDGGQRDAALVARIPMSHD